MKPNPSDVARLAYQLYVEDGKPEGQAEEHWQRAMDLLCHPENHSDHNLLTVPSEPELTPQLQEKGQVLDRNLPSDPHTGAESLQQRIEIAVSGPQAREEVRAIRQALKRLKGILRVSSALRSGLVHIHFDASQTNPAAIHEAIETAFPSVQNSR